MTCNTRFAPSPTGDLHIGSARTALFAWAFAKKHQGKFILRIEDTDVARSESKFIDSILASMLWLGLDYDIGPIYQTNNMLRYQEVIQYLLNHKLAYYCYCNHDDLQKMREEQQQLKQQTKYNRHCLHNNQSQKHDHPVVRFKNPDDGSVVWNDLVKGRIEIDNTQLDDFIIMRQDKMPTYNFCVVVDDFDMQITHVIRGDDHINNTPKQINLLNALNFTIPQYAHTPMILRDDGQKMSKRFDAVSVLAYKNMGILPEALLNYLARLCWGHDNDEIFTMKEFINWFELNSISPSPAKFDLQKLLWVNSIYIKNTPNEQLKPLIIPLLQQHVINTTIDANDVNLLLIIDLLKSRVSNLNDLAYQCSYFYQKLLPQIDDITQYLNDISINLMQKFALQLQIITWDLSNIKACIKEFCQINKLKMADLAMPLRLQLCGTLTTPSIDQVIYLIGQHECIRRINSKS